MVGDFDSSKVGWWFHLTTYFQFFLKTTRERERYINIYNYIYIYYMIYMYYIRIWCLHTHIYSYIYIYIIICIYVCIQCKSKECHYFLQARLKRPWIYCEDLFRKVVPPSHVLKPFTLGHCPFWDKAFLGRSYVAYVHWEEHGSDRISRFSRTNESRERDNPLSWYLYIFILIWMEHLHVLHSNSQKR
jgi:hypothetical protein